MSNSPRKKMSPEEEALARRNEVAARLAAEGRAIEQERQKIVAGIPTRELTPEEQEHREYFMSLPEEEKEEWLRRFWEIAQKHREKVRQLPGGEAEALLARFERLQELQERARGVQERAEEALLQTHADRAELTAKTVGQIAEAMTSLLALPPEHLESLPLAQRLEVQEYLRLWQEGGLREKCLGLLPIEERQKYE